MSFWDARRQCTSQPIHSHRSTPAINLFTRPEASRGLGFGYESLSLSRFFLLPGDLVASALPLPGSVASRHEGDTEAGNKAYQTLISIMAYRHGDLRWPLKCGRRKEEAPGLPVVTAIGTQGSAHSHALPELYVDMWS